LDKEIVLQLIVHTMMKIVNDVTSTQVTSITMVRMFATGVSFW